MTEKEKAKDKRIREAILNGLIDCRDAPDLGWSNFGGIHIDDCIAWLEEQGKKSSWKPSKEEMDVLYSLSYITNEYDEHKEDVITHLYQDLKREFFNDSSYENMFSLDNKENDVRRRSTIQVLEYARSLDAYNQYGKADIDKNIAWLEKQGDKDKLIQELGEYKVKYTQEILEKYITIMSNKDDERLRKNCIHFLELQKQHHAATFEIEECIDWLEKQGEDKKEINNFDVLPGLYKCIHRMFDGTPDGRLLFEIGNVYKCLSKHDRAEFEVSYGHSVYLEDPVVCKYFIPFESKDEQASSQTNERA